MITEFMQGGKMFRRSVALAAVLAIVIASAAARAGDPGTSGFLFLRLGNGARASGMGEAFTAVADDATGMYWNPAGLANIDGVELNLSHSEWLLDIRFEQISVVNEMLGGAVGLSFTGLFYGDLERRGNYPSILPDGTFSPYDFAISAGYATDILPNLSAGASAKFIYEKIDFESASGWAVDLGILHRSMIEGLTLAASVLNLGPQAKFVEEEFYPPFQMRVGASYRYDAPWLRGNLIAATDMVVPNDGDSKLHLGAEYNYERLMSVRVGYKSNYYVQGITFGFGVDYRNLRFDYAFMPIEFDLGDSHRFSLTVGSSGL
jgi:hypothetical protein